jgi:hypothetical protein
MTPAGMWKYVVERIGARRTQREAERALIHVAGDIERQQLERRRREAEALLLQTEFDAITDEP